MSEGRRVLIVQFAGDYREAVNCLSAGQGETYYAQKYSVDSVAHIGKCVEEVAVLACLTEEPYNEMLSNGVRGIGAGFRNRILVPRLLELMSEQRPTELVVRMPFREVIEWATQQEIRTLCVLADSFRNNSPRAWLRNRQVAKLLNHPRIEWVGNHNINPCRSLAAIGVDGNKIIPWDWMHSVTPHQFPPKQLSLQSTGYQLMYAGPIIEEKGVADLLHAASILIHRGVNVTLQLAGSGDVQRFTRLAKTLGIQNCVRFMGQVPNVSIVPLMRESDVVVIPSRHRYAEGLPMTVYEGLSARTPIIASDHPMFRGKLIEGVSALNFGASKPQELAARIETLLSDPELYGRLSVNAVSAWESIQVPVKFAELLRRWVLDSNENHDWLHSYRLASGRYENS